MASKQASEFWLCYKSFGGDCDAVRMVDEARAAVVRDAAERARRAGFDRVRVFSTVELDGLMVERTRPVQAIGDIVSSAAASVEGPVCYASSGMPAMSSDDWAQVLEALGRGQAVSNRMFSCDWVGAPSGRMLITAEGEHVDNRFALRLRDERSVEVAQFERSARSLLDVDTPTDLAVLAACVEVGSLAVGSRLRSVLEAWSDLLSPSVQRAVEVFDVMTRRDAELMIAGRVSGSDWAVVDRDTSCRVRMLSEERGLRTREQPGRSLLATLYERTGAEQFARVLESLGDAVIWDTRPFYSHLGWDVSRCDRFSADLGRWMDIEHKGLRELVRELSDSAVLMGGHSLVAGGMLAGIDAAWTRLELGRELSG